MGNTSVQSYLLHATRFPCTRSQMLHDDYQMWQKPVSGQAKDAKKGEVKATDPFNSRFSKTWERLKLVQSTANKVA